LECAPTLDATDGFKVSIGPAEKDKESKAARPHPKIRKGRMKKQLRIPLRVFFYKEDGDWVAHCLEFDLLGDGETKEEALESLSGAIEIQVEEFILSGNAENLFAIAESRYFEMFAAGRDVATGELELSRDIDSVHLKAESREYSDDLVPT